jgi:hypothetical protein
MLCACSKYLDVVPEGVSRLENAFAMREEAKKYLYTCYSYMPRSADPSSDPGLIGGDDMWTITAHSSPYFSYDAFNIARGMQNSTNPLANKWNGMYRAIRDCNIFLENIETVPDMEEIERRQWIAEVKCLKAYYHFWLLQMYGPVPLVRKNLPIDINTEEPRVKREAVDTCVNYIVQLLNEAAAGLPLTVINETEELGRITLPIALSLKAKVLVTAASRLFNGNTDQQTLHNLGDNSPLFDQEYRPEKWDRAVKACEEAIHLCVDSLGMKLYEYPGDSRYKLTDTIMLQLTLRNAFTEKWNSEIIWANTQSLSSTLQLWTAPKLNPSFQDYSQMRFLFGVPIKIAEMFYSEHGLPIEEDRSWDMNRRYELRTGVADEKRYIVENEQTVRAHFNREPRFYAWIGFDRGIWHGQGVYSDADANALWRLICKMGERNGVFTTSYGPTTGYFPKKWVHYENVQSTATSYTIVNYPWPLMRLSDLFLLYAEALNEAKDSPTNRSLAIEYLNKVRRRAGIPEVADAWESQWSANVLKHTTQRGLQDIIRRERTIELAFEGHRFWDIRRWMTAMNEYKTPVMGWDLMQSAPAYFYTPQVLFRQQFGVKDYFWPIRNSDITVNPNLVQNTGW